jgi:hypothetical protein
LLLKKDILFSNLRKIPKEDLGNFLGKGEKGEKEGQDGSRWLVDETSKLLDGKTGNI